MRALVSNGDRVARYESAAALAESSTPQVAAVILDSQPHARRLSYKQVRERYGGPLIVLLDKDERRPDLPPDGARRYLHRPFEVAELSKLLNTPVPELGSLEAAIIAAWSRHATAEPAAAPVRPAARSAQTAAWRPSRPRRARVWVATIVALMGLLLVLGLSDRGSCAPGCTQIGGGVAGAAETPTPLTSTPATGSAGGGAGGARPPGSSATSSEPPTPVGATGFPVVTGIGGLIESINPITSTDTTPPSGPVAVPGVPAPPGVSLAPGSAPPGTTPPPGTSPPTTSPPGTSPPSTTPPSTAPPTTTPPTTDPPTTAPPTTDPPTTAPPTTDPPTTAPPTTEPPTTAPPTTEPPTTAAPTTAAETTAAPPTT